MSYSKNEPPNGSRNNRKANDGGRIMAQMCECGSKIYIRPHPSPNNRAGGKLKDYRGHDLCRKCFRAEIKESELAARYGSAQAA